MNISLSASYAHCQKFSKQSGSNFLLSFWFLPPEKRQAMYALYAFFRHTDDLTDQDDPHISSKDQLAAVTQWREMLEAALAGEFLDARLPAVVDTLRRYEIPPEYLRETIAGVETDLTRTRLATFRELEHYCYQVASTIGLSCLQVWGVRPGYARQPAIDAGIAFQLTNILRDLREDAQRQRIYLPLDELARFGVSEESFLSGTVSPEWMELMQFQIARAQATFDRAQALQDDLSSEGRRIYGAMTATYRGLLNQIATDPTAVLRRRLKVARWQKLRLMAGLAFSQMNLIGPRPLAMETR